MRDLESVGAVLLLLIPLCTLVKGALDFLLLRLLRPRPLPRMDPDEGVPPEGKTLCVLSVLLGCCEASRLEELRLLSREEGENLLFGLLADLPAAEREETPEDAALLAGARQAVEKLNRKYGGGFYLFTRPRSFDGESWCGHERKRGALTELARLVCGEPSALRVEGERAALEGTRYLLSLDADIQITPGALGKLIAAALHPLNRPECDPSGVVRAGHGLVHPRIETELESACATDFALIFAGPGGSDPYGGLSSELYMDAFDCGGFAGKGLLDARLLLRCSAKLPEGRVLSHDALEGAYLRGAYMSDAASPTPSPPSPWPGSGVSTAGSGATGRTRAGSSNRSSVRWTASACSTASCGASFRSRPSPRSASASSSRRRASRWPPSRRCSRCCAICCTPSSRPGCRARHGAAACGGTAVF